MMWLILFETVKEPQLNAAAAAAAAAASPWRRRRRVTPDSALALDALHMIPIFGTHSLRKNSQFK
jgi:hypothetical protein